MVNTVLNWGLDLIRSVQGIASPGLTTFIRAFTQLGSEYFYILFLPIIMWCIDEKFGVRFGLVFLFSAFTNNAIKGFAALDRPYTVDPSVKLAHESSYSFPSGHAQSSLTFWALSAQKIKNPVLCCFCFDDTCNRIYQIYLGVHYPSDVIGGWVFAAFIILLWVLFGKHIEAFLSKSRRSVKVIILVFAAAVMYVLSIHDTSMPGAFFGAALGFIYIADIAPINAGEGTLLQKLGRFIIGIALLAVIFFGCKLIFPKDGHAFYQFARFFRYALVGIWASLGAPWLFLRLKLAERL